MGKWAKIRSWHYVSTFTRVPGGFKTRCGRYGVSQDPRSEPPLDEKSCESCLRLKEHDGA